MPTKVDNVLFVDIPSVPYATSDKTYNAIARDKAGFESRTYTEAYARQLAGRQFGYGLLSVANYVKDLDLNISYAEIDEIEASDDPTRFQGKDIVFIGLNFCVAEPEVVSLSEEIKQLNPDCTVIVGGQHATHRAKALLDENPSIDMVIQGEGEIPTRALLQNPENFFGIPGTAVRYDGQVIEHGAAKLLRAENIPAPDYSLLPHPMHEYGLRMITQRGCVKPRAATCVFCAEKDFFRKARRRSIRSVVGELERLSQLLGQRQTHIHFADSIFPTSRKRTVDLCHELGRFTDSFEFSCNLYATLAHRENLQALKEANFNRLFVGLEDPSPAVLRKMRKGVDLRAVVSALEKMKEFGFKTAVYAIYGLPGSTPESLGEHAKKITDLVVSGLVDEVHDAMYTPIPGTDPYDNPQLYDIEMLTRDWHLYQRRNGPVFQLKTIGVNELRAGYLDFRRAIVAAHAKRQSA